MSTHLKENVMRKITLAVVAAILFFSCQKNETSVPEIDDHNQRTCASDEAMKTQLQNDPGLGQRMAQLEAFTKRALESGSFKRNGDVIEIPVVVHILYNNDLENISDAQ